MKLSQLKTIDINAKEWRDKINGNSYFSSRVTLNYGMNNQEIIKVPFQYGYGDQYLYESLREVQKLFPKSKWFKENLLGKYQIQKECKIIIRNFIQKNCLKKELYR
tara:strand:+ start:366 stop:683 length:318 start_codon:yes stop_codon:yes gene_type:complete